jgi:hypothetical protein
MSKKSAYLIEVIHIIVASGKMRLRQSNADEGAANLVQHGYIQQLMRDDRQYIAGSSVKIQ